MNDALRRAWTEIVTPEDYEEHMARIGQAQAGADLTRQLIESARLHGGASIVIAGAGTGQALDFLDAALLRPFHLTFTDLNPRFLECLKRRLADLNLPADIIEDDFEKTKLEPGPYFLLATLLLEHIDWRRGVEVISHLRPAACGIIIQENPPEMKTALTPGRALPPSIAAAAAEAHPVLIPYDEFLDEFATRGFRPLEMFCREVADGKRLIGVLFQPRIDS